MSANRGIEALAMIMSGRLKGTLVAFSERLPDKNGNLTGWLIGGPTPGTIALKPIDGFDITDAAALPDGGIVILERRFRYSEGIKMRIRRVSPAELKPGAVITGEVLLEATDSLNIDNMEAIGVHRRASGETILTLMSDDNFSPLQRTLIMQFTLPAGDVHGRYRTPLRSDAGMPSGRRGRHRYWEAVASVSCRFSIWRFSRRALSDSSLSSALSR
jgi:hypothetical protein